MIYSSDQYSIQPNFLKIFVSKNHLLICLIVCHIVLYHKSVLYNNFYYLMINCSYFWIMEVFVIIFTTCVINCSYKFLCKKYWRNVYKSLRHKFNLPLLKPFSICIDSSFLIFRKLSESLVLGSHSISLIMGSSGSFGFLLKIKRLIKYCWFLLNKLEIITHFLWNFPT